MEREQRHRCVLRSVVKNLTRRIKHNPEDIQLVSDRLPVSLIAFSNQTSWGKISENARVNREKYTDANEETRVHKPR